MRKPNVVFILTDDQGYGDLACTGNPVLKTPHIDRLYEQSVHFTDYHVTPLCAPTRAGLFTGRCHNSTGVWHTVGGRSLLRSDEVTIADVLKEADYRTGIFGKWHLGDNYPFRPFDRGFEECVIHGGGGIGQTNDYWGNDYFDDVYFDKGERTRFSGYCTEVWFDLGMEFISKHKDEPFFCLLTVNAPHQPLYVPERYKNMYPECTEERARFNGMITCIDDQLGRLREHLEKLNLADDTLLIYMADNGTVDGFTWDDDGFAVEGYNAGMRGSKGWSFEGGHRVPFFMHYPNGGMDKARDFDELTHYTDVFPTIAELCGAQLPVNRELDGVSLVPYVKTGDASRLSGRITVTDIQFVKQPVKWRGNCVMMDKYRLVGSNHLSDISIDPEQRFNIIDKHPEIAEKLKDGYERWWVKASERFDEEIPIIIGSEIAPNVCISSHEWRGNVEDCCCNQGDIREAKRCNQYAEILVASAGIYRFTLRRWPEEEKLAITAGIDGNITWHTGGKAVPAVKAEISVGDCRAQCKVTGFDEEIVFELLLKEGSAHLQTWFTSENGEVRGAYYVYVSKVLSGTGVI